MWSLYIGETWRCHCMSRRHMGQRRKNYYSLLTTPPDGGEVVKFRPRHLYSRKRAPTTLLNSSRFAGPHNRSGSFRLRHIISNNRKEPVPPVVHETRPCFVPFSGVTKGRNYKPILCEFSHWSYQLTIKQSYALLQQLPGLIKCVNYSLRLWTRYELRVYKI
jgi:hypothetical protein